MPWRVAFDFEKPINFIFYFQLLAEPVVVCRTHRKDSFTGQRIADQPGTKHGLDQRQSGKPGRAFA